MGHVQTHSKLYGIQQGIDENTSAFYERLHETARK